MFGFQRKIKAYICVCDCYKIWHLKSHGGFLYIASGNISPEAMFSYSNAAGQWHDKGGRSKTGHNSRNKESMFPYVRCDSCAAVPWLDFLLPSAAFAPKVGVVLVFQSTRRPPTTKVLIYVDHFLRKIIKRHQESIQEEKNPPAKPLSMETRTLKFTCRQPFPRRRRRFAI